MQYFIINKFVTLIASYFNTMHELSIAMGIVNIAEKEVKKAAFKSVTKIELQVGKLSGVEIDSLNFVWQSAVKNTVLECAVKDIEVVKGKGKCIDCDTEFEMLHIYDTCPNCQSNFKAIISGKELRVKAIEVI